MSQPTDRTPLVEQQQTDQSSSTDYNRMLETNEQGVSAPANEEPQPKSEEQEEPVPEQTAWIFSIVLTVISAAIAALTNLWISCAISFGINWIALVAIAWPLHTEKFYDFTGMITFISVDTFAFFYNSGTFSNIRSIVLFIMPLIWTLRLGIFLYMRIHRTGGVDKRFDDKRNNFPRFFMAWTFQAVWAYFDLLPVLVVQYRATSNTSVTYLDIIGWSLWVFGFLFELIADIQKSNFKNDASNKGKFMNKGLWSISRHPNYFGEIVLWIGITISACNVAIDWDWFMLLSPFWTIILLVFISGIPLAEKASDKRYGKVQEYLEYKAKTPVLVPLCFCWK